MGGLAVAENEVDGLEMFVDYCPIPRERKLLSDYPMYVTILVREGPWLSFDVQPEFRTEAVGIKTFGYRKAMPNGRKIEAQIGYGWHPETRMLLMTLPRLFRVTDWGLQPL